MPEPTLAQRVGILEQKVEGLETLPARVAAVERQIVQLREEMRGGLSAIREEIRVGDEAVRAELRGGLTSLRDELGAEIRQGDEETRRYMRVLHEEVIARIATIAEGRRRRRKQ